MKIAGFDLQDQVLVIAEIGVNHEGSEEVAAKMLDAAADCDVGAVKFQTFTTELYQSPTFDPVRFARLKRFELSREAFRRLAAQANKRGVLFLSSPFDIDSARFLNDFVPAFKIASGDNNFWPLIRWIAEAGKPVLLSSGLSDFGGVAAAVSAIREVWKRRGEDPGLAVLHCVSSYPVHPEQASLRSIPYLAERLSVTAGYSDHVPGLEASAAALALGARVIEKHFTLDKNFSDFRDHKLSATPDEMRELVRMARQIPMSLGRFEKALQPAEKENLLLMRRSIAVRRALGAGHLIREEDLMWIRPGTGTPPGRESEFVGRTLSSAVPMGTILTPEHCVAM